MNIYNKVVEVVTFNIAIEYIKLVYHKKDFIPHIKFGKILKLFIDHVISMKLMLTIIHV